MDFLAKFFEKQKYADDFLRGKLFANTISYFKELESDDGKGDNLEGAIVSRLDDGIITLVATIEETGETREQILTGGDLAAPFVMSPKWFDHIKVLCMYADYCGDFRDISDDNFSDLKKHIKISKECIKLGRHAIVITNTLELLRRVEVSASQRGYKIRHGLVTYYDPKVGTPVTRRPEDTMFFKRKEFEYQSEYRLAIDTGTQNSCAITLDIGDISDIAIPIDTLDMIDPSPSA